MKGRQQPKAIEWQPGKLVRALTVVFIKGFGNMLRTLAGIRVRFSKIN